MKHPLIIGAGGVASYLLPVLIKSFSLERITLMDHDILEERNLDRQMFERQDIGSNKARALADLAGFQQANRPLLEIDVVPDWFDNVTEIPATVDVLICVADNHLARAHALEQADLHDLPCIIGGNEYLDNEAYIYLPAWKDTPRDPRIRYATILTAGDEGSPLNCTGEAQVASPQLAIANFGCAHKILHLLWTWMVVRTRDRLTVEAINCLPFELSSSLTTHHGLT